MRAPININLGVIDYEGCDKHCVQKTKDAISWLRKVDKHGSQWSVYPPSRSELYPNMCIDSGKWQSIKKEIAEACGDLTMLWYVGAKNRNIAFSNGITSWFDEDCSAEMLGINGERKEQINRIIKINQQNNVSLLPTRISTNMYNWRDHVNEVFVDFETMFDMFSDFQNLPHQPKTDQIFMIGVGWMEGDVWNYQNFTCNKLSEDAEYRIMG